MLSTKLNKSSRMAILVLPAALTSWFGAQGSGAAFDGSLKIVAGDATATIPIRIKIRPSPWGPFALLVLSLVFGALMRWWAESGRALHRQYDRYIWLSRFSGEEAKAELERARFYLDRWIPAEAEKTLDAVEEQLKPTTTSTKLDNSSAPVTMPGVPRKTWRQYLLNVIPATIFLVTSLSIAMYGFQSLYAGNLTFGAKGLGDWINLAGWGFAAGYAGKTVNDYFIGKAGGTAGVAGKDWVTRTGAPCSQASSGKIVTWGNRDRSRSRPSWCCPWLSTQRWCSSRGDGPSATS